MASKNHARRAVQDDGRSGFEEGRAWRFILTSRALLTGCHGFTGRYVAAELEAAGYEVVGLAHDGDPPRAGVLRANLLDRAAIRCAVAEACPEVVVHLAAISFVAHGDTDEIYRVNVVGTRNLLEALAEADVKPRSVVLASSANIYGNASGEPIDEATPPMPANDYAVSKLAMEYMARLWMESLPITLVRPFNYTGVGQGENFLIPKIVAHFQRGEKVIEFGNTDGARDFSDVRDVAHAYAAILGRAPAGEVVNICSGNAHSLDDVLAVMAKLAGYKIDVRIKSSLRARQRSKAPRGIQHASTRTHRVHAVNCTRRHLALDVFRTYRSACVARMERSGIPNTRCHGAVEDETVRIAI